MRVQTKRKNHSRLIGFFLPESLQFLVPLGLLLGLFDEVADGVASEHFLRVKDLIEILLQLLPPLLDVLGAFIGDSEDLFLGKWRSNLLENYRFLMLLSSSASWTFLN
jgi:hypothetical protein